MKLSMGLIYFVVCFALLSMSCGALRQGWVKVDYLEGQPSDVMVCEMRLRGDDMTARCLSLEETIRIMKANQAPANDFTL